MQDEIWKDINGFEGSYQVSNKGRVCSIDRSIMTKNRWGQTIKRKFKGKILALSNNGNGYLKVNLSKRDIQTQAYIHRLVADAFLPKPKRKKEINHIDGIKSNNRPENLEWVTTSQNIKHAYKKGLNKGGSQADEDNNKAKLTEAEVVEMRKLRSDKGLTLKQLANIYGVHFTTVGRIIREEGWANV